MQHNLFQYLRLELPGGSSELCLNSCFDNMNQLGPDSDIRPLVFCHISLTVCQYTFVHAYRHKHVANLRKVARLKAHPPNVRFNT